MDEPWVGPAIGHINRANRHDSAVIEPVLQGAPVLGGDQALLCANGNCLEESD